MIDSRVKKVAKVLVDYSVEVKAGDRVLVECTDPLGLPLAEEVYKEVLLKGAYPHLVLGVEELLYFYFKKASKKQLRTKPEVFDYTVKWLDKAIRIKAMKDSRALGKVKSERLLLREKVVKEIGDRLLKKRWVLTYWPTMAMAREAKISLKKLEDLYFKACTQDWKEMGKRLRKIKKKIEKNI